MADASYSVYLLHLLIILPIDAWLLKNTSFIHMSGALRFGTLFILAVISTYTVSWFLYRYVERPGIAWGKSIIFRFSPKKADIESQAQKKQVVAL